MSWDLRHGDCLEGLRGLADKSVDCTITDPPYEAEAHTKGRRRKIDANGNGYCVAAPLPFAAITEDQRTEIAWHLGRVSARWILVFCQVEASQAWATALTSSPFGIEYIRTMVWIKPDGQPQFTGDRPGCGYESIVVAHRGGKKRWNGGGKTGLFTHIRERGPGGNGAPHPTTKPLPLMRELVSLFSDPGELVLDPFAGSGSTGVACGMLGRRFIGWELDAAYYEIARRRLNGDEAKPRPEQPSLFGETI